MSALTKAHRRETWALRAFGFTKVPMLFWCMPRVVQMSSDGCAIEIPLSWRTKNHLGSMYFGALAVGADCAGGLIAIFYIQELKAKVSLVFKDFKADFVKRPTGNVVFRCNQGAQIRAWVDEALRTGERINGTVDIEATVPKNDNEVVARFALTMSLKDRGRSAPA